MGPWRSRRLALSTALGRTGSESAGLGELMPTKRSTTPQRLADERASRFDEYQQLIGRMQRAVDELVPAGSTVLVVSKGDPALVSLGPRTGWHFPRAADGQYAGFHPADNNDAINRLEVQRQLGARYLVIPSTSSWWLDHYSEFIAHVRSCGRPLLEEPDLGAIFELDPVTAPALAQVNAEGEPRQSIQQMVNLLEAVLPATARIAVIATKDDEFVAHSPLPAIALRLADDAVIDPIAAVSELRALADGIADFLVVPISSREVLDRQVLLAKHIEQSYSLVTNQRNVCTIYDLRLGARGNK